MNLTDELNKLAGLHRDGQLSEAEFAAAKSRLLAADLPAAVPRVLAAPPPVAIKRKAYKSSRWSAGNLFFPDRLIVAEDGLHFRKGTLFGSQEEHINYRAIASLRISRGIFLANLDIETSGGSQPIHVNGLWKSAAREIQAAVQAAQRIAR
ncbi:MAG TPA: SHOCT domain-containing protein [Lacunisphaera sp.]|nr:SHOCT domain-containing protein [Lacunisphaera sp.]